MDKGVPKAKVGPLEFKHPSLVDALHTSVFQASETLQFSLSRALHAQPQATSQRQ
jgi:hypothetical protein